MEAFEAELAEATNLVNGELLGAVAMVIDNKGERECHYEGKNVDEAIRKRESPTYTVGIE